MNTIRLATAMAISITAIAPALADTIRCESRDGRERYCAGDTRGGVSIQTQLSGNGCFQGDTWGYDNRGVWVSGGCAAIFQTGYGGSFGGSGAWNGNNAHDDDHNDKGNAATAVAIGAILGAVIIASAANKNKQGGYQNNYDSGCTVGKQDRSPGQSMNYSRHASNYDSRTEQAFASGYNQCWQNR